MRRTVTEDKGHVPDYTFRQGEVKRLLGIGDRQLIHDIRRQGCEITIRMDRCCGDERVTYTLPESEFKGRLGIDDPRHFLLAFVDNWSRRSEIQISMTGLPVRTAVPPASLSRCRSAIPRRRFAAP